MLEPDDRNLLLDSLRPPPGYELDHAIGTTFTLDLLALLIVPTSFTLFELEEGDGPSSPDPVALLRAVREYGERITVFCQGGQIAIPPHDQLLYANLEDSVFQVVRPGNLFHPKVWLLRFTSAEASVRYRLLCLSRNLTFDRSWDTILRLDGELGKRKNAYASNHPLGDFFEALPGLQLRPSGLSRGRAETVHGMAAEVRRVAFNLPEGFDQIRFWPLGLSGHRAWPFTGDIRRMLVISPFVGPTPLKKLGRLGDNHVLVSRLQSLDDLEDRSALDDFEVHVMDDATEIAADAEKDLEEDQVEATRVDESLRGLHAKAYAADRGRRASIWVGSANATHAGLERNAELLVELSGKVAHCGVDAILGGRVKGGDAFGSLLAPYNKDAEPEQSDPRLRELEASVERLQLSLARERIILSAEQAEDGGYEAELLGPAPDRPELPKDLLVSAWPITQNPGIARVRVVPSNDQVLARFGGLTSATITPFVAFEIEARTNEIRHTARFVVRVPLRGAPKGRHEDVLRALLSDKEKVLRYLLLILAETKGASALAPEVTAALSSPGKLSEFQAERLDLPLLEGLLRVLVDDAEKLEQVARLLADLQLAGAEASELLPKGFQEIWEPIWASRQRGGRS